MSTPSPYLNDLSIFARQFPPVNFGLGSEADGDAYEELLIEQLIPDEAASKIKHIVGFQVYAEALADLWPPLDADGVPIPPAEPLSDERKDRNLNLKLAEMYFIGSGLMDFVSVLKTDGIGKISSMDAGSQAVFELAAMDAAYFGTVRSRYVMRAFAALGRAGFPGASVALAARVSTWAPSYSLLYTYGVEGRLPETVRRVL